MQNIQRTGGATGPGWGRGGREKGSLSRVLLSPWCMWKEESWSLRHGQPQVPHWHPAHHQAESAWRQRLPWCSLSTVAGGAGASGGWVPAHIMMCRRRCRARWSEREKLRSQSEQRKGLIPVCLRKCRVSSSERANFQVQPSQVHL